MLVPRARIPVPRPIAVFLQANENMSIRSLQEVLSFPPNACCDLTTDGRGCVFGEFMKFFDPDKV